MGFQQRFFVLAAVLSALALRICAGVVPGIANGFIGSVVLIASAAIARTIALAILAAAARAIPLLALRLGGIASALLRLLRRRLLFVFLEGNVRQGAAIDLGAGAPENLPALI